MGMPLVTTYEEEKVKYLPKTKSYYMNFVIFVIVKTINNKCLCFLFFYLPLFYLVKTGIF